MSGKGSNEDLSAGTKAVHAEAPGIFHAVGMPVATSILAENGITLANGGQILLIAAGHTLATPPLRRTADPQARQAGDNQPPSKYTCGPSRDRPYGMGGCTLKVRGMFLLLHLLDRLFNHGDLRSTRVHPHARSPTGGRVSCSTHLQVFFRTSSGFLYWPKAFQRHPPSD